jgi:PAS domain S-box-containing protein
MIVVELWTTLKRYPRIGVPGTALAAGKGAPMDHDQKMKAPLLAELLALCQQIARLGPEHLTPPVLDEMVTVALLYAEGIVNTVRVPLVVLDAALHVLMANRYFYEYFQVTPRETESHQLYNLGDGQWDIPALRDLLDTILPHHTAFDNFEVTHTFPHIGRKTILVNARRIGRAEGRPPLILLAFEDITARQQAEVALRQQRDMLVVTLSSIGDAVMTTDPHGRITYLNPVAEALTGWPGQDALGQPCEAVFRLVHARTRQPLESPVAQVLRDGTTVGLVHQTMLLTRDGRECLIADLSAPIRSEGERLQGVVVVFRDVSAQHQLEEQVRQAHKMEALGTLAGGIAHDFNNILAAVLGYTDLAQRAIPLANPAQPFLQQVLTAGLRAKALVQQILAFSHSTPVEQTPVSLAVVLREALPFLRALLPATITLEDHITTEASVVLADATQLHQIVLNLGANAAYAMRDTGGSLEVRLEAVEVDTALVATHPALRPGPYVRLTIRDSGPGIPRDVVARMYEPFFTTKEVGQGTGLGLSVVYGIVAHHGGTILVESTLGQGSTFTIYLPRLVEPSAQEARSTSALG